MPTAADCAYNVQCLNGHVMAVLPGTELEQLCAARVELDALILCNDDCPKCVIEAQIRQSQDRQLTSLAGCPLGSFDEDCPKDCPCQAPDIPDSRYDAQVRFYSE
jgi:hypothetical protein